MNDERNSFIKTDLREAIVMLVAAALGALVASIFSTQPAIFIGSAVIAMTLGKLLVRVLRRNRFEQPRE